MSLRHLVSEFLHLRIRVPRTASKWTVRSIAGGEKVELSKADRKPEKIRCHLVVAYVYFQNSGEAVAAKKKLEWTVWNGVSMSPEMWIGEENENDAQYR